MRRCDATRVSRGMTLIEVILAVSILSLGLTMMLSAAARCVRVFKVSRNYTEAKWVLDRAELEYPLELMLTNDIHEIEVSDVRYENGFTYSRVAGEDDDEDGLYAVRSRVTWGERGKEKAEEIVRYVWFPEEDEL